MTNYTYRIKTIDTGFLAECCETSVAADGVTEDEAVAGLRNALIERLKEPNAVAPPSNPRLIEISLRPAPPLVQEFAPQGPGEAM